MTVSLSKTDYVTVHPADDVEVLFPRDLDPAELERVITLPDAADAPITAGQKLGTMELKDGDTSYATVDLLASNDVEADSLMVFRHNVTLFFQKPTVRIGIVVLAVLILLLAVLYFTRGSRRRRYGRNALPLCDHNGRALFGFFAASEALCVQTAVSAKAGKHSSYRDAPYSSVST